MLVTSLEFTRARTPQVFLDAAERNGDRYLFVTPDEPRRAWPTEDAEVRRAAKSVNCTAEYHKHRQMWCIQYEGC